MSTAPRMPQYSELMWPAIQATIELGGSATVQEMYDLVVASQAFPEELQAVPHGDGRISELDYRLHWARTHLRGIGALLNSARGVWAITEHGRTISEAQVEAETKAWRASLRERRRKELDATDDEPLENGSESSEADWKEQLLNQLFALSASGFERLAQRLLREAGFVNVTVTDRSRDGGIDGVGVYRPTLVSFHVYFQCKKYQGLVRSPAVRDFRGAMAGRGEKGLLITTGSFTKDATAEANRDGAPPVELIDGDRLCELLREYRLGVDVRQRIEEDITIAPSFFDDYH